MAGEEAEDPVLEALKRCMTAMMVANPQLNAINYISVDMTATQCRMLIAAAARMRELADNLQELAQIRVAQIGETAAND